jgi:hypothetical protein
VRMTLLHAESVMAALSSEDDCSPRDTKDGGAGSRGWERGDVRQQATPLHGLHPKDEAAARAAAEALSHITDRFFESQNPFRLSFMSCS